VNVDRWSPWDEFLELRREIDRLFASFFKRLAEEMPATPAFSPPADVYETERELVIRIGLPGVIDEDVDICLNGDQVIVQGERDMPFDAIAYHHREWEYGRFRRIITLPFGVNSNSMRAQLNDGVLEIRLSKR
jgi:HSP20 family protein